MYARKEKKADTKKKKKKKIRWLKAFTDKMCRIWHTGLLKRDQPYGTPNLEEKLGTLLLFFGRVYIPRRYQYLFARNSIPYVGRKRRVQCTVFPVKTEKT